VAKPLMWHKNYYYKKGKKDKKKKVVKKVKKVKIK
jgi:hypothetical protein